MPFAEPSINKTTDLFVYANTVTDNFFGTAITWTLFIIVFFLSLTLTQDARKSFAAASFTGAFTAIMLRIIGQGLISDSMVALFIIMSAISAVILYVSERY